jgi:light-regulated signal transduction histidine kinase (bacteriophytochrome)
VVTREELPIIRGEASQLLQVFQNLIGNAVKYRIVEKTNRLHVSAKMINNQWRFCFQDNGIGIQSQYFEKIFIIFKRLHNKSEYSGTGIGLALCKRIIDNHGGRIWVESEYGQGACFYFTLPLHQ